MGDAETMPNRGREMLEAAVPRRPGEGVKAYLNRAAKEIPLGFASTEQCWKGNYWSRETAAKIEAKVKKNEYDLSSKTEELVQLAEAAAASAVAVGQDRAICDSLRGLAEQARDLHRAVGQSPEGKSLMKIAFAIAVATSAFLAVLPPAYAQYAQSDYGVRYPRPPGGGTRPRPRPPGETKPAPPPPTKPPPDGKPPGYGGYR